MPSTPDTPASRCWASSPGPDCPRPPCTGRSARWRPWAGSSTGGRYTIGARLFERATLAGGHLALRDAALPFLQELCAATRETANLALLDGCDVLYLEKLVGRRPVAPP